MKIGNKNLMLVPIILSAMVVFNSMTFSHSTSAVQDETAAFSTFHDGNINMTGSAQTFTVGQLFLPGGRYVIFAKMVLDNQNAGAIVHVGCKLEAGADFDESAIRLRQSSTNFVPNSDMGVLAFNVVHNFTGGTNNLIKLSCQVEQFGATVQARDIKITAIRVGSLSNVPF
jgi:hypothetical protein